MKKLFVLLLGLMLALTCAAVAETIDTTVESRGVQVPVTIVMPEIKEGEKAPVVVFAHGHGGTRAETGFATIIE